MRQPPLFLRTLREGASPEWRELAIRRVLRVMTLLLLAATWQLWIPQQSFPQVPLFNWAGKMPDVLQWAILAECIFCLLLGGSWEIRASLHQKAWSNWSLILFSLGMGLLICVDQHRLQPWAYEAVLVFLVLACVPTRRALTLIRLLTLSIYFFSAVSKLDYAFLHTMGQQFTEALMNLVGMSHWQWPAAMRVLAALVFPLGELLVAVLLAVPRTRSFGVYAALIMHGVLLLVLGPLGMNQQWAVLIWNVQFMLMAVLLFYGSTKQEQIEETEGDAEPGVDGVGENIQLKENGANDPPKWLSVPVQCILLIALSLPLFKSFGYWDHWLSWDLYSPGTSKTQVFLHPSDVEHLPEDWQAFAQEDQNDPNWVQLRLDLWSLDRLAVPIYPQARFQLGLAVAVADKLPAGHDAWIVVSSPADRFTGQREQTAIKTRPQLDTALEQYWLNARPAEK